MRQKFDRHVKSFVSPLGDRVVDMDGVPVMMLGQAPWSDEVLLARLRDLVLPLLERPGPVEAWIVDETGFLKKGRHSVGIARRYSGQLTCLW